MAFAITMLPTIAGHRWVTVEGPVDASTAADVRGLLRTAIDRPARRLTIDLRDAQVIDEAGRTVLDEAVASAERAGMQVDTIAPAAALTAS
ncbi:STAS domain-containing protein [Cryptosporangium minutisporangium]|uniref:STAS domain-containing protein n=1 Tax=Cryptosporangium minutisporangium TaxID=113569 RepID=A0ABP6SSM1_9ACTN